METKRAQHLSLVMPLVLALTVAFQNCDGGFQTGRLSAGEALLRNEGDLKISILDESGATVADTSDLLSGQAYQVVVDGTNLGSVTASDWSFSTSISGICVLNRMKDDGVEFERALKCDATGDLIITVRVLDSNNKEIYGTVRRKVIASATPVPEPPLPAVDGVAAYANSCAVCHGPLETSARKGRTAEQIHTAIETVPEMSGLSVLSDAEIAAISAALQ